MNRQPNIVWFSFEDTNPFYGCYGDSVARTPNLDRLAAEGCIWTRCFSTAGVCAPARSAVITGMYPISIGTHHMRTAHTNEAAPELPTPYESVLPHFVKCFTEYLRAAGYYCTNNVKTDYQFEAPITAWDELSPEAHWRNRPKPDQPFFAVFNPTRTHESGMWDENLRPGQHPGSATDLAFDPADMVVPPFFPDTQRVRESLARMYTNIEKSDQQLGELLAQLEEDGLAENTIVMHWSDHGPLPRGKRWPYDSGIRVPLIVRGAPGVIPGSVCHDLVSTIDLGPTVLSLAELPVPHYIQGQAFLGRETPSAREYVFASRDRYDESYDMIRAARDKRFKYIRHYNLNEPYLQWIPYRNRHPIMQEMWRAHLAGELNDDQEVMFRPRPAEELYDTESDPWELHNLAQSPEHFDTLTRMREAVDGWTVGVGDMGEIPETEMVRRWYPDGKQPKTAAPVMVPISASNYGIVPLTSQGRHAGFHPGTPDQTSATGLTTASPAALQLYCATQGASIAYTLNTDPPDRWRLYTNPVPLPPGQTVVRARAIRIGYKESDEAVVHVRAI